MIWHIFRKDWKLLWPLVAVMAGAYVLNIWIWLSLGHFPSQGLFFMFGQIFWFFVDIGVALVVIAAVHQDTIPGDRQDWLVRPIHRRHLLMSKLLFIGMAVLLPLFGIDVATVLLTGFSGSDALASSIARTAAYLSLVCLPAAALAAVTRNLTETVVAGALTIVATLMVLFTINALGLLPLQSGPSLTATFLFAWAAIALVATPIALGLQYTGRRTLLARMIVAAAVTLGLMSFQLPWHPVFAAYERLLPGRNVSSLALAFDPSRQNSANATPNAFNTSQNVLPETAGSSVARVVILPLRIAGLPANTVLNMDNAEISLTDAGGNLLYQHVTWLSVDGAGRYTSAHFNARQGSDESGAAYVAQKIIFPSKVYAGLKDRSVRAEITYSLTLMAPQTPAVLKAVDDDARVNNGSWWCKSKVDDDGDEIEVGCLSPTNRPDCASAVLENPQTGQHNPEALTCLPIYMPVTVHPFPMVLASFGGGLRFRDPNGLVTYTVDETQLDQARVVVTGYKPIAHLTRHLTIPEIRLGDWAPKTAAKAATP